MFGEQSLSSLARDLLAEERGRHEGEALKSSVIARARAELDRERPSGVGIRALHTSATTSPDVGPALLPRSSQGWLEWPSVETESQTCFARPAAGDRGER